MDYRQKLSTVSCSVSSLLFSSRCSPSSSVVFPHLAPGCFWAGLFSSSFLLCACLVLFHRVVLLTLSDNITFIILRMHLLMKVCFLVSVCCVILHVSELYSNIDLTFELNILILVFNLMWTQSEESHYGLLDPSF